MCIASLLSGWLLDLVEDFLIGCVSFDKLKSGKCAGKVGVKTFTKAWQQHFV